MTPERIDVNDYDRARLIHAALTLYYGQELTQADVARRLGWIQEEKPEEVSENGETSEGEEV